MEDAFDERTFNVAEAMQKLKLPVYEINDRKGFLTIYWKSVPTLEQENKASMLWETIGNELKSETEHDYSLCNIIKSVKETVSYTELLKSPEWQKRRLFIFNRDNWTCQLCGDKETQLNVHHKKYSIKNLILEPDENLITLCKHCHSVISMDKSLQNAYYVRKKQFNQKEYYLNFFMPDTVFAYYINDDKNTTEYGNAYTNEAILELAEIIKKHN